MFRSRANRRTRRAFCGAALCLSVLACGDVKEWEPKAGTLVLSAEPLPPSAGLPLTLALTGSNVGPVDVYQGDERLASFANLTLDGRSSYVVTAISDAIPRAVAEGYDFKRIEVDATAFTRAPGPVGNAGGSSSTGGNDSGGGGGGESKPVDNCPGVTETPDACSMPGTDPVALLVLNRTDGPVTLYRRELIAPDNCFGQILAVLQPGASRMLQQVAGNVIQIRDDKTAAVLRTITLPSVGNYCTIVL